MKKLDLRNAIGFFCLLKACALIGGLRPGEYVDIACDDLEFVSDLRLIHPECEYSMIPGTKRGVKAGEYLLRIHKSDPKRHS
jgi:hypothetical protein